MLFMIEVLPTVGLSGIIPLKLQRPRRVTCVRCLLTGRPSAGRMPSELFPLDDIVTVMPGSLSRR